MRVSSAAPTIVYLVTEDWYFCSHRLPVARAAAQAGYRVVVVTRVRDHAAAILDAGLALEPLDFQRRSLNPISALGALIALVRIYRRLRPQLVHHVALKPVILGTAAAWVSGVPHVINAMAGLGFVFASGSATARWLRPLTRAALRLALAPRRVMVVVQNDADADVVSDLGVPAPRINVIRGSGVDLDRFSPAAEPAPPVVATMVSRMLLDKGVVELVEAARLLRAREVPVAVRLVGAPDPGNPSSIDPRQLEAWQAEGLVQWLGPTENVPAVWANSHLAVLPSYREGLPKSLLEAAACARALIASDVPGCRDVVVAGETGLLVPARSVEALADAIEQLVRAPALRRRFATAARARVVALFGQQRVVDQTLALYAAALERTGS